MTITVDLSPWSVLWFGTGGISKGAHWIHLWPVLRQNPTVSWQGTPIISAIRLDISGYPITFVYFLYNIFLKRHVCLDMSDQRPILQVPQWFRLSLLDHQVCKTRASSEPRRKTVIKQLMANQMCFFEKSRNHARLIQLIFWLVDVGGMFKFGINKFTLFFSRYCMIKPEIYHGVLSDQHVPSTWQLGWRHPWERDFGLSWISPKQ